MTGLPCKKHRKTQKSCCSEVVSIGIIGHDLVFLINCPKALPLLLTILIIAVVIEVSSREWGMINMNEQEQDMIYRMHRLVGDRWDLIAGRIPGRKAPEIERFWIMTHSEWYQNTRNEFRNEN